MNNAYAYNYGHYCDLDDDMCRLREQHREWDRQEEEMERDYNRRYRNTNLL